MCHRGSFRDDIYKKCVLRKDADNGLEHVVNECAKLKNEIKQLLKDLNNINNTKDTELHKARKFHYSSKSYTNKKEENKDDNKGIQLIKEFYNISNFIAIAILICSENLGLVLV